MSYLFLLSFIDLYIQVINDFSAIVNNKTINGNNLHGDFTVDCQNGD